MNDIDISYSTSSINNSPHYFSGKSDSDLKAISSSPEKNINSPSSSSEEPIKYRDLSDFKVSTETVPNIETSIQAIVNLDENTDSYLNGKLTSALCDIDRDYEPRKSSKKKDMKIYMTQRYFRKNHRRLASEHIDSLPEGRVIKQSLKDASDEERITFLSRALANPAVHNLIVDIFCDPKLFNDSEHKANYLSKAYQRLYSNKTGRKNIPEGGRVHDTAPVNFIWLGGLLPDRYLKNVKSVASATPQREVVIWIDRN